MGAWIAFAACVGLIAVAGSQLSRYGDVIAEKTGMGGTWIGLILLATVTSLPELVTGITSVTIANAPNIAVGNVLGACVFNLAIIVVLDFFYREGSVYTRVGQGHILSAAFGIMIIGVAGMGIVMHSSGAGWAIGHVAAFTPIILALYVIAVRTVFRYERRRMESMSEAVAEQYPHISLRQASIRYAVAALVVVSVGIAMPFVARQVAQTMGWTEGFVGTVFVAFATSTPELVVTLAAVRLGAIDMAVSNLFGSNLLDVAVLGIDDLVYTSGPLANDVSPTHAISALSAMIMTGVAIVGLLYRPESRVLRTVGWVSIGLFSVYILNIAALYLY